MGSIGASANSDVNSDITTDLTNNNRDDVKNCDLENYETKLRNESQRKEIK